ncbi:MAG: hypothetical protein AAFO72_04125 [Pseudomonadota bacterium]
MALQVPKKVWCEKTTYDHSDSKDCAFVFPSAAIFRAVVISFLNSLPVNVTRGASFTRVFGICGTMSMIPS